MLFPPFLFMSIFFTSHVLSVLLTLQILYWIGVGRMGTTVLLLILVGMLCSFFLLVIVLSYIAFIELKYFPSIPNLSRDFIMREW